MDTAMDASTCVLDAADRSWLKSPPKVELQVHQEGSIPQDARWELVGHPVRTYLNLGMRVSINTDDPRMFGNSMADEYEQLMLRFGFSRDEIRHILRSTASQTWLPEEEQKMLEESLTQALGWNSSGDPC